MMEYFGGTQFFCSGSSSSSSSSSIYLKYQIKLNNFFIGTILFPMQIQAYRKGCLVLTMSTRTVWRSRVDITFFKRAITRVEGVNHTSSIRIFLRTKSACTTKMAATFTRLQCLTKSGLFLFNQSCFYQTISRCLKGVQQPECHTALKVTIVLFTFFSKF